MMKIIQAFEETYPNIHIDITGKEVSEHNTQMTLLAGEFAPQPDTRNRVIIPVILTTFFNNPIFLIRPFLDSKALTLPYLL